MVTHAQNWVRLSVTLGPDIMETIFDDIQHPLRHIVLSPSQSSYSQVLASPSCGNSRLVMLEKAHL